MQSYPTKPDTRQHLNNTTLLDRRHPQSFTQRPKEKEKKVTSLSARRPLCDRPLSPSGVVTGLVPRACTCRKPARSDGVEEKWQALRPTSGVSGLHRLGEAPQLSPISASTELTHRTEVNSRTNRSPGQNTTCRKTPLR